MKAKMAWHEAGHIVAAFALGAAVRYAVVADKDDSTAASVSLDELPIDDQVAVYLGGAVGQYLHEKPGRDFHDAIHDYLKSPYDANYDYMRAFGILMHATKNIMESRRRLNSGIDRTYRMLSEPSSKKAIDEIAQALLEACPQPIYGYHLRTLFEQAKEAPLLQSQDRQGVSGNKPYAGE